MLLVLIRQFTAHYTGVSIIQHTYLQLLKKYHI